MNPRGVHGPQAPAAAGAPAAAERSGKGGGFAAVLSQLGVSTHKGPPEGQLAPSLRSGGEHPLAPRAHTGDDASAGKDRRPSAPAPAAASAPAPVTGQILPGVMTRRSVEIAAETGSPSLPTVARPLQITPSMSNNAAHARFEAPRLVAEKRSNGAGEVRAEAAKPARADVIASQPQDRAHAKVLTDGASRKSDTPTDARNLTKGAEPAVTQAPISTVRAATVSPVAHTRSEVVLQAMARGEDPARPTVKMADGAKAPTGDRLKSETPSQPPPREARGRSPAAEMRAAVSQSIAVKNEGPIQAAPAQRSVTQHEAAPALTTKTASAHAPVSTPSASPTPTPTLTPTGERPRPVFTANDVKAPVAATVKPEVAPVVAAAKPEVVRAEVKADAPVARHQKPVVETAARTQPVAQPAPAPAAVVAPAAAPASTPAPAATPAPATAAKRAVKAEPVVTTAPQFTKAPPAAKAPSAPVAAEAPAAPTATPVKTAAPAQPVAEERTPITAEKATPSEARPAPAKKPAAPAHARSDEQPAPALPVPFTAAPVAPPAAPVTAAPARPVAFETAAPVVAEIARAAVKPVVVARAHGAEPELAPVERRKRSDKHQEGEEGAKPTVAAAQAPLPAHAPFERVAHRAAANGHAKVESTVRREPEAKEARAGEPAAPAPVLAPEAQHRPVADGVLPAFTPPPAQPDAAPPVAFAPAAAAPIVAQAAEDPGLSVTVAPHAARVSVESSEGDLALHLRIKDGNAEVSIGGSLAPMFEQRSNEVQTVLAGEGLSLGRFDTSDQSRQGQQAPREVPGDEAAPARPTTNPARPGSAGDDAPVRSVDGRIHVTA